MTIVGGVVRPHGHRLQVVPARHVVYRACRYVAANVRRRSIQDQFHRHKRLARGNRGRCTMNEDVARCAGIVRIRVDRQRRTLTRRVDNHVAVQVDVLAGAAGDGHIALQYDVASRAAQTWISVDD